MNFNLYAMVLDTNTNEWSRLHTQIFKFLNKAMVIFLAVYFVNTAMDTVPVMSNGLIHAADLSIYYTFHIAR